MHSTGLLIFKSNLFIISISYKHTMLPRHWTKWPLVFCRGNLTASLQEKESGHHCSQERFLRGSSDSFSSSLESLPIAARISPARSRTPMRALARSFRSSSDHSCQGRLSSFPVNASIHKCQGRKAVVHQRSVSYKNGPHEL